MVTDNEDMLVKNSLEVKLGISVATINSMVKLSLTQMGAEQKFTRRIFKSS